MATKTLYVKEADLPLFEKAQKELGDSLSAILADCIRGKLAVKGVTEDAVRFYDVEKQIGINIVPLSRVSFCPRVGEAVFLPGEHKMAAGEYAVEAVHHTFAEAPEEDFPSPARVFSVRVDVRQKH